jgi:hypothetical protein
VFSGYSVATFNIFASLCRIEVSVSFRCQESSICERFLGVRLTDARILFESLYQYSVLNTVFEDYIDFRS